MDNNKTKIANKDANTQIKIIYNVLKWVWDVRIILILTEELLISLYAIKVVDKAFWSFLKNNDNVGLISNSENNDEKLGKIKKSLEEVSFGFV